MHGKQTCNLAFYCRGGAEDDSRGDLAARVAVQGCGQLILYASRQPQNVTLDGLLTDLWAFDEAQGRIALDLPHGGPVRRDVAVHF